MANVLGNSTPNAGMQAPPPPPLPAGMSIVSQNGARMQAPPPPPLPAGLHAIGATPTNQSDFAKQNVGMQAPPPPSLPAGLHAMEATPTVRNEYIKQNDFAKQNALRQVDGRPKMSLTEAMNADRQENIELAIPEKEPVAGVNGGDLSVGDYCFARSGMDGLYYYVRIDSIDDAGADVTFFDESQEHVIFAKMYTIGRIPQVMQCFANWNNKGSYYPAKVIDFPENAYAVVYDENPDFKDTLGCDRVRFAPW